ncbi:unnamed protein product [Amoebophrya sp. A120]|nr:unnamed protein product [Amoebophrya sp. A120]|eukprot:GSA120T00023584001.1
MKLPSAMPAVSGGVVLARAASTATAPLTSATNGSSLVSVRDVVSVSAFGKPEVLRVVKDQLLFQSENTRLDPDQVLIQVRAFGINPSETYQRAGAYANLPKLPYTPGRDCAGTVVEIGTESALASKNEHEQTQQQAASWLYPGARVFTTNSENGCYASHCIANRKDVFPLPERLTFEQGAGFGVPYYAAWRALVEKGGAQNIKPGTSRIYGKASSLLVNGASGGVGLLVLQMARKLDLGPVLAFTAGSERGRELLRTQVRKLWGAEALSTGADAESTQAAQQGTSTEESKSTTGTAPHIFVTDHTRADLPVDTKFDLILEMQAQANLGSDLRLLAKHGKVVVVGNKGHSEGSVDARLLMQSEGSVTGFVGIADPGVRKQADEELRTVWIDHLQPVVDPDKTFRGLAATEAAHTEIEQRPAGTAGRVVVSLPAEVYGEGQEAAAQRGGPEEL